MNNMSNESSTIMRWSEPSLPKDGGTPTLKNHTVTHHDNYLYCFGGYDGRSNHMNLLVYSLEHQRWNQVRQVVNWDGVNNHNSNHDIINSNIHGNDDSSRGRNLEYGHHMNNNSHGHSDVMGSVNNRRGNSNTNPNSALLNNYSNNQNQSHQNSNQRRLLGKSTHSSATYTPDFKVMGIPPMGRNGHTATLARRRCSRIKNQNAFDTDYISSRDNKGNNSNSVTSTPDTTLDTSSLTLQQDEIYHDIDNSSSYSNQYNDEFKTCIFIIGGWLGSGPLAADDLHILDITHPEDTLHWLPPIHKKTHGTPPGPCNMHTADFIPSQNEIYLFRGGNGREYLNDLHALEVDSLRWRVVETVGEIPQQRANHSSAVLEDELFIFGGWNGKERLNDIHILDIKTNTWSKPQIGGILPHPRAGMTLTALRDRLYLFGGSGTSSKCFQDLHIFDRKEMSWIDSLHHQQQQEKHHFKQHESVDDIDDGNRINQSRSSNQDFNDMSIPPTRRSRHSVDSPWNEMQQKFSGFSLSSTASIDNTSNTANPNEKESAPFITVYGKGPGRRAGHAAIAVGRLIFVFGGSCGSDYLNDFFVLDTDPREKPKITSSNTLLLVGSKLRHFSNSEEFADVIFLVEGQRIYGHKLILSLVSDCFRAMFSSGFKEGERSFRDSNDIIEIPIPNCSYDAFVLMMDYIYSGEYPLIKLSGFIDHEDNDKDNINVNHSVEEIDLIVDLLELADQFLLDHLKELCESMLQHVVNADTVEYLLLVSRKVNSVQLESVCEHFQRNYGTIYYE